MSLTPANWLVDHAHLLPLAGTALDVACGSGRHALWLAAHGMTTDAVDNDPRAIDLVTAEALRRGLPVHARVMDLERGHGTIRPESYNVIVVFHYLHRPLFPALAAGLKPGGLLVYETFTRAQAQRGKPTNPAFLLEEGELPDLVRPLEILRRREGDYEGRMVSSVIAWRPPR